MAYAILRFSKPSGGSFYSIEAHHERQKEQYRSNPDIDHTRTRQNFHIIRPACRYRYQSDKLIQAAGCRTRKDSVRLVDTLLTASPAFFESKTPEQIRAFFKLAAGFMEQEIGRSNIITAVVHLDERTPHMHLCFVPLTKDNRLSAKEILGNKKKLAEWQDKYFEHMAAQFPELERGIPATITGREHLSPQLYKEATALDDQRNEIRAILADLKMTNVGRKKGELSERLEKWMKRSGVFVPILYRFQDTLQEQEQTISRLECKLYLTEHKLAEEQGKRRTTETVLRQELKKIQKKYNRIPLEIRQEVEKDKNRRSKQVK